MTDTEYINVVMVGCLRRGPASVVTHRRFRSLATMGVGLTSPSNMARIMPDLQRVDDKFYGAAAPTVARMLLAGFPVEAILYMVFPKIGHRPLSPLSRSGKRRIQRMVDFARVYEMWCWRRTVTTVCHEMSASTTILLGRMPAYAVEAVIFDAARRNVRHLTPSKINWDYVARVRRDVSASRRAAVAWSLRPGYELRDDVDLCPELRGMSPDEIRGWLAPQFPAARMADSILLARGFSPVDIAIMNGVTATASEAHAFMVEDGQDMYEFVISRCIADIPLRGFYPRSIAVARWLRAVWDRGHWGVLKRSGMLDRITHNTTIFIEDVMDEDLANGPATGVRAVAASVRARLATRDVSRYDPTPIASLPSGWTLPEGARPLLSRADLTRESDEMGHCVRSYHRAVARRECVVLALAVDGNRSTLELGPDGSIRQHRGPGNTAPDPACVALAEAVVAGTVMR